MNDPAQKNDEDARPRARQLSERYDGRAKVTGTAKYAAEFAVPGTVYGFMVQSTIAHGTVLSIDRAAAERAHGVLAVLTPFNAPRLPTGEGTSPGRNRLSLLQDTDVYYNGQPIAVVVAVSLEAARQAAGLLKVEYKRLPAALDFFGRQSEARPPKQPGREPADTSRGDFAASMAKAAVRVEATYTTPIQNHNSMETHSTIAWWDGDKLNLYDSTQFVTGCRQTVAAAFGIPAENVRVQCPFTGGGFGSKGSAWSHVILTAMAAKMVRKPVKLALERTQMFGPVGSRPATVQKIALGAASDGKLLAVRHDVVMHASVMEDFMESSAGPTRMLYASESVVTSHRMVDMNLGVATYMRGPGESTGTAAFESAMDELAEALKIDPVQLRIVNYADRDEGRGLPFSSKHLKQCYEQAAERFGWSRRRPAGTWLEGNELIGFGMASATRHANRGQAQAIVRMLANGHAEVASGTQELGTGTYTILADTAAAALGIDPRLVDVRLGDTMLPKAPGSTGSTTAASVGPAVRAAARKVVLQLMGLAIADEQSPLHGHKVEELAAREGRIVVKAEPATGESFIDLLMRHGGKPMEAAASAEPGPERNAYSANCFGAVFVEVAVDRDTHMVKVRRVVGTYDVGTLLNDKTGMSQLTAGVIWGISFALHEDACIDPVYGRTVNENFADYHVSANADIGKIDLTVLNIPDTVFSPMGARGIGEISITGVPGAIANAVYNATGRRVREFPITPDKILRAKRA